MASLGEQRSGAQCSACRGRDAAGDFSPPLLSPQALDGKVTVCPGGWRPLEVSEFAPGLAFRRQTRCQCWEQGSWPCSLPAARTRPCCTRWLSCLGWRHGSVQLEVPASPRPEPLLPRAAQEGAPSQGCGGRILSPCTQPGPAAPWPRAPTPGQSGDPASGSCKCSLSHLPAPPAGCGAVGFSHTTALTRLHAQH